MDVNPKSHAQKKRWKKFASHRDYRYGGKIGGHSVNQTRHGGHRTQKNLCEERLEVTSYSEQDSQLYNAGIKLPVEKALGCSVSMANKNNFGKEVKDILENSGATTKVSTLEVAPPWSNYWGRATVKKTWYAMPLNKEEDTNGMVAHVQQKKERAVRKMLAEFGIKTERGRISSRVKLTRFLPHGEIYHGYASCILGTDNNNRSCKMGLAEIKFASPMKVVGIGFRAKKVRSIQSTHEEPIYVKVAPVCAKVQFQTFNSNTPAGEWTGTKTRDGHHTTAAYSGPKDPNCEVAHNLDIPNCKSLKVEAMTLSVWGGTLARDVRAVGPEENRWRAHDCFEIFVYGSAEPRDQNEEEEDQIPVGSGCIKNRAEVRGKVTVICHTEVETVVPKYSLDRNGRYRGWMDEKREKIHTDEDFCIRRWGQEKDGN